MSPSPPARVLDRNTKQGPENSVGEITAEALLLDVAFLSVTCQ